MGERVEADHFDNTTLYFLELLGGKGSTVVKTLLIEGFLHFDTLSDPNELGQTVQHQMISGKSICSTFIFDFFLGFGKETYWWLYGGVNFGCL